MEFHAVKNPCLVSSSPPSPPPRPLPSPTWPFFIVIGLVAGEHSRINPGEPCCIVTRSKYDRRGQSLLTLESLADFRENDGLDSVSVVRFE